MYKVSEENMLYNRADYMDKEYFLEHTLEDFKYERDVEIYKKDNLIIEKVTTPSEIIIYALYNYGSIFQYFTVWRTKRNILKSERDALIVQLRDKGLTQEAIEFITGIPQSTISKIENLIEPFKFYK